MENNEAYTEALKRIEACKAEQSLTLDLSGLGLEVIPVEVSECRWIVTLDFADNEISVIENLEQLTHLENLNFGILPLKSIDNSLSYKNKFRNFINKIEGLEQLVNLQHLDLSNNHVNKIEGLEHLVLLQQLNLYVNQITKIEGIKGLVQLQRLDLSANRIKKIEGLETLVNLHELYSDHNLISKIVGLEQFVKLQRLDLSSNLINKIEGLEQLVELKHLDLSGNLIYKIEGLEQLIHLQKLYLSATQINKIEGLEQLIHLQEFYLSATQINKIEGLERLVNLQYIDLSNNKISDLRNLKNLSSLKELDVSRNSIEDIDSLFPLIALDYSNTYFDISNNPVLQKLHPDLVNSGWPPLRDWLIALQKDEQFEPINEVKLLLLGNTNVGKSNLLHFFETGNNHFTGESTHGIRYKVLTNLVDGINLNCWDFGGQEFYHATHQLFFSPDALHIVLWSKTDMPRFADKLEACFDLAYWLRCIEQLISRQKEDSTDDDRKRKKTAAIVCENKIDLSSYKPAHLNQPWLQTTFADLELIFSAINLVPLKYMDSLKELIKEKAKELVTEWPTFYKDYLRKIRKADTPYVSLNDIYNSDVTDSKERVYNTMRVFNNMGLLLYFPSIIADKVFTQPQVLLDLLYEKVLGDKGKESITKEKINKAVASNILKITAKQVIELLLHFDLIFQIPEEGDIYFIPQYLSAPSSFIDFFRRHQFTKANIRIVSDNFLMNVAMLKVFGAYGQYVKKDEKREHLFWKDGIVIEKDKMLLMVKFDREQQCIELYPDNNHKNFALQKEVVRFVLAIPHQKEIDKHSEALMKEGRMRPKEVYIKIEQDLQWKLESLNWQTNYFDVLISLDGKFFTSWNTIAKQVEQGIFQVQAEQKIPDEQTKEIVVKKKTVSVFDYNKYLPEKDKGQMKKVFISYSKEDLRMVNKFIEHLSALQLDGKIAHWYCTELTAGSDWNHEIQEHFDAADIVCFMISSNFMKTKYIHEHEIKKAFERKAKGDNLKIVPIILDFCKWTTNNNNLGQYTALPYMAKPVADFQNENMAWYIVQECLRLMIENDLNPTGDYFYTNSPLPHTTLPLPKDVLQLMVRIAEGKV